MKEAIELAKALDETTRLLKLLQPKKVLKHLTPKEYGKQLLKL